MSVLMCRRLPGHVFMLFSTGKMIDNPTVLQARNVLALAERLEHVN